MPFFSAASEWRHAGQMKRDQQAAAIDRGLQAAGPATEHDDAYLRASAVDIARELAAGKWTAGAVVRAYVRRAAMAHELLNCLTEVRFAEAIQEADALDREYVSSKKLRGRLHGVPMTLKDSFKVAGLDYSCGFSSWVNHPALEDGGFYQLLKSEGAVLIAKTNVPQTLMFFECTNPVFGRTENPWKRGQTCGGSSGGEAAVLAVDGSAIGFGTDIGGSVRIPAFYCGIYALKPSTGRISNQGRAAACPGQESIAVAVGPMARTVDDVDMLARITFGRGTTPADPLAPVPYREYTIPSSKHLKFGFYTFDGCYRASPANERAVLETVSALKGAGHEVVEFEPPNMTEAIRIFLGLSSADGYETIRQPMGSDPQEKELYLITLGPKLPAFLRTIMAWIAATFMSDKQFLVGIEAAKTKNVAEVYKLNSARDEYTRSWYDEVWRKYEFDAIIAPTQAVPAPAHSATTMVPTMAVATFVYNLTGMPVGVVPVTRVKYTTDAATPEWLASGPRGGTVLERRLYEGVSPIYDPKGMDGLPVGVQVVGRLWDDEKVLAMMRVVDNALGNRGFGPGSWSQ